MSHPSHVPLLDGSIIWKALWVQCKACLCVCSWCGQMFEWRRDRRLWVLLLSGKLHLRHWRDARALRAVPAHRRKLQHWGEWLTVHLSSTCPPPAVWPQCSLHRVRRSSRRVCTACLREFRAKSSSPSAAATFSREWSLRFASSQTSTLPYKNHFSSILFSFCLWS